MQVKTKAIVLSSIKFQEKSLIVKCFKSHGLKSYFVRDAFSGRKSNQKIAYQPLSILEIEAVHKNKGTLENKEIKISTFQTIHSDIYKSTIVMF
jgi:DNA repair protein RecO (recombination protein O)